MSGTRRNEVPVHEHGDCRHENALHVEKPHEIVKVFSKAIEQECQVKNWQQHALPVPLTVFTMG